MRLILSAFFLLLHLCIARAQQVPIGQWREHLPYRQASMVAAGNDKIYCATAYNLFSVGIDDQDITRYTKLNGLHDAGIHTIGLDATRNLVVIAYQNGNLDLLQQEQVYNLPDVLRKNIQADKTPYSIFFNKGLAWVCMGFGIVQVNTDKKEIADTYIIGDNGDYAATYAVTTDGSYYYAATAEGIKRAAVNGSNLANYRNWTPLMQGLQADTVQNIVYFQGKLICQQDNRLFYWDQNSWQPWYTDGWQIGALSIDGNGLLVCEQQGANARVLLMNANGAVTTTLRHVQIPSPIQAAGQDNGIWIADAQNGLVHYDGSTYTSFTPNAPADVVAGNLLFINNSLWATAGAVTPDWTATGNRSGYFVFEQEEWHNFDDNTLKDLIPIAADATGNRYIGSFGNGLLTIKPDGSHTITQQPTLPVANDDPQACRVSGLATDAAGNLWATIYGADRDVWVKKPDNTWQSFRIPYAHAFNALSDILIDDLDQKWIISPRENGLFVFNHGSSLENTSDDQWKLYRQGAAQGNLPSNDVRCLAKDKDGWIWVGTAQGIAIFACAQDVFGAGCSAYLPIVKQDNFAGYLFSDEQVNAIAVDGANQKWVATEKNGVWLINGTGEKILAHFDKDNSPLPDNAVYKIAIHPVTGEVFFATRLGLVSYRGTATEGVTDMKRDSVLVFPNPVAPNYSGIIAIRGLVQNAQVKITDISGKLVFATRAQGGQAIWDGKDYTGRRPQSGIYLVFATGEDGAEKLVTKLAFIN